MLQDPRNDFVGFHILERLLARSELKIKGQAPAAGLDLITLVDVEQDRFSVALIPHTLQITTLGRLQQHDPVNLETDVLAKYVETQLNADR